MTERWRDPVWWLLALQVAAVATVPITFAVVLLSR